jgi:hypothetical protein
MIQKKAVVVKDEVGMPNYMTMFYMDPEKMPEEVPDMFKIGGKTMAAVLISQFTNTVMDGIPCSLPYQKPTGNKDFDEADMLCRKKGKGWHLMTNTEFKYLTDEADGLGNEIHGNTNFGSYYKNPEEKGIMYDSGFTLTGLDPLAWSHDGTKDGVFGLCGNFWEWIAGLRLTHGEVQYIPYNDAATVSLAEDYEGWKTAHLDGKALKLSAYDGVEITTGEVDDDYSGCHMADVKAGEGIALEVPEILFELGILPRDWRKREDYIYVDSDIEEAMPIRGSSFRYTSNGGVSALNFYGTRSNGFSSISFRSALFIEDWKLVTDILTGA